MADAGVAVLPPDIVWMTSGGLPARPGEAGMFGDLAVSTSADQGPAGGLVGANPLRSAMILLLFTDARADAAQITFADAGDRRGWPGDGFDIDRGAGEAPLGSLLWLFRRHELTDVTAMQVRAEAIRALQPMINQQAAARIDVVAQADKPAGRIALGIDVYGRDGRKTYTETFDLLWKRPDGL